MMNMKILAVVTPMSIYYGCSARKTFWGGIFTNEEKYTPGEFTAVNKKHCGHRNVSIHRDIKGSDNYVTLES